MSNIERLSHAETSILLTALDEYALKEDPKRSPADDTAIGDLAAMLVGDDVSPPASEFIVLWGEADDGSNTALDDDTIDGPVVQSEEDRDGEEVDDEDDLDDDDEDDDDLDDDDGSSILSRVLAGSNTALDEDDEDGELALEA